MRSEPTRDQKAAVEFLNDLYDMFNGTGRHAEHTQQQVGRCVYCSCGARAQGKLPEREARRDRSTCDRCGCEDCGCCCDGDEDGDW